MSSYEAFASVYDMMQYDVDYEFWMDQLSQYANRNQVKSILELACGTATIGIGLSQRGFSVEGLDISDDMLTIAQAKSVENHVKMRFYHQDMVEFQTKKTYDMIFSMCDGINYILDLESLSSVFENVSKHLNHKGLFIFDVSSEYKLEHVIGNNTFAETFDEEAYIWENEYDKKSKRLNFSLTLFKSNSGHYERYEEYHEQKAYSIETLKKAIIPYFDLLEIVDGDTFGSYTDTSHRICFIAKKK